MPYHVVYDVTQASTVDLLPVAIAFLLILLSLFIAFRMRKVVKPIFAIIAGTGAVAFCLLWLAFSSFIGDPGNGPLKEALRTGRCTMVEGRVTDYHPFSRSPTGKESYVVSGTRFEYSGPLATPGFHETDDSGSPIREGLQVRIHHLDKHIARLEVAGDGPAQKHSFSPGSLLSDHPFLVFMAAVMVFFGLLKWLRESRRSNALRNVAAKLQLRFETGGEAALVDELASFPVISGWYVKRVRNVMMGSMQGAELTLFEFSGRRSRQSERYSAVARFRLPQLQLPAFTLQHEQLHQKFFNFPDIDFPEFPEFSERFLLAGTDEAAIRQLFDHELITMLQSKDGITVEADGDQLIFYREGYRPKPAAVSAFLNEAAAVFGAFVAAGQRTRRTA